MSSADAPESGHDALLSDAALAALELGEQPFAPALDNAAMFADEITAEQLADIRQALITGDDLLLILGERGAGKSTLLAQLAANSGLRIQCFSVRGSPRFSTRNLFVGMLEAFKVRPPEKLKTTLDELIPCLQTMIGNNTLCVVVLDDAQAIAESELTMLLSGMLYLNSHDESLLRIALAAPPEFEERIPELLPEGADLPYSSLSLEPFDTARASRFLRFRLERAGRAGDLPFDDDETAAIVERSGGQPAALQAVTAEALENAWGEPGSVVQGGAHPFLEEEDLPPELLGPRGRHGGGGSFLGARAAKLALGTLAGLMILGGLLLFRPAPDADENGDRYRVVEQRKLDSETERLRLLQEDEQSQPTPADELGAVASGEPDRDAADDAPDEAGGEVPAEPDGGAPTAPSDEPVGDTSDETVERVSAGTAAGTSGTPDIIPGSPSTDTAASGREVETAADTTAETAGDTSPGGEEPGAAGESGTIATPVPASTPEPTSEPEPEPTSELEPEPESAPAPASVPETVSGSESTPAPEPDPVPTDSPNVSGTDAGSTDDGARNGAERSDESSGGSPVAESPTVGVLESPNWVLVQDATQYTVQMIASTERAAVETFLIDTALPPPNSIFSFDRRGTTWYALVHGLYPNIDAAREAVERMPPEAQANQPWIRSIGRIQNSLKARN